MMFLFSKNLIKKNECIRNSFLEWLVFIGRWTPEGSTYTFGLMF